MRRGIISAAKAFLIRLLFSVIREWLSRNLPPTQPASVRERGQENRVYRAFLLEDVERRFDAFVHE